MPTGGLASWLGKTLLGKLITSYAINTVTNKLFGPKTQNNSPTYAFGALQTQTNSGMAMPIIYGRVKCAGNLIWSSGEGKVQHKIISFGVGRIKGFSDVRLNNIPIEQLPGCSYTAYVGDGEQLIDNRVTGATQEEKAKLVGGLKYDAYLAITATASDKLTGDYNVTAIVDGRIVRIYLTSNSYVEDWTDNPAWCELDFKTSVDGCGMDISCIDTQTYINVAPYFDFLINGKKRFTLNLIMDEKKSRQDWLTEIFCTCRSYPTYQRGLHGILVDKPENVSQVFKVKADESIETWWQDNDEDVERLQIEYIDPSYEYTKVVAQADRVQLPGETSQFRNKTPLTKKISIYGINNFEQASREAWFHLNKAQTCPEWIQYTTNKRALNRSIGDVVGVWNPITEVTEPGLAYKRYRIMTMTEPQENKITMVMQEYNPNLYGDMMGSVAPVINITTLPNAMEPPPNVYNLYAEEYFREQGNGVVLTDLVVNFSPPDYMFYSYAEIYIKSNQPASAEINIPWDQMSNVTFNNIGDAVNKWTYVNRAVDNIVLQNLVKGNEYSIKIVAVNRMNLKATFDTAPALKHLVKGKTYTPNTPTGLTVNITDNCLWHWNPLNNDCDFAELRTDRNIGNTIGLLAKTSSTQAIAMPPTRHGVVYLYAHNTAGYYSDPAIFEYNHTAPLAPTGVVYTKIFQGVTVTTAALPLYCKGINVHANDGTGDAVFFSPNNAYTMKTTGGIYDMSVAYVDLFGEGEKSPTVEVVVKATIDPKLLEAESLSLREMDPIIRDAVAKAQVAIDTKTFNNNIDTLNKEKVSNTVFNDQINKLVQVDGENKSLIQQTATQMNATMVANKTDADGKIAKVASDLTQTASSLTSTIQSNKSSADSAISQIQQTANGISQTVQANKADADGKVAMVGSRVDQQATQITSVVTGLNNANTAIAQTSNAMQLRATKADLISLINMCPEAITILSKLIHISGDTLFDNNVIVNRMLSALCITADKIAAGAITADKISATLAEIKGKLTVSQIDAGVISADKITTGSFNASLITTGILSAGLIYQAGYQVRACQMIRGTASNGSYIPLPAGFTQDQCIWGVLNQRWSQATGSSAIDMNISSDSNRFVCARSVSWDTQGNPTEHSEIAYYWIMGVK